jgi:hypothetical protein
MLIPFEEMPDHARLWIYQAERKLLPQERDFVAQNTERFLSQWQAHGQGLKAAYSMEHDQFLIIAVDETFSQASGCSIDASVHLIKALERELGISFMTTSQVAFMKEEKVQLYPFSHLKAKVQSASITPETLIFDNTVKNMEEFRKGWIKKSSESWVSRYFS